MSRKLRMVIGSDNVFRDIGFPEAEAQNLLLRADLMIAIERYVRASGLSQTQAAKKLRITQPRLSDLFRHRIERFSLDALVSILARTGMRVALRIKKAA